MHAEMTDNNKRTITVDNGTITDGDGKLAIRIHTY